MAQALFGWSFFRWAGLENLLSGSAHWRGLPTPCLRGLEALMLERDVLILILSGYHLNSP